MQLSNVCRLCLKEDNLIWVFDKRFENGGMKDVVYITTGVEISTSDTISQKICAKCSELTIRMFEFRKTSQRSDSYLKERSKQYLKTNNLVNLPTEVKIKKEKIDPELEQPETKPTPKEEVKPKPSKIRLHPSIRELYKQYSGIRLPDICLNSDYAPVVSLPMHGVERYFQKRKLDFDSYVKAALQPRKRVATKRTSASNKPRPKSHKTHKPDDNSLIDVKINRDSSTNKISIKFLKNTDSHHQKGSSSESSSASKERPKPKSRKLEEKKELAHRKRKSSEAEKSNTDVKKPAFIESLGLITKPGAAEITKPVAAEMTKPGAAEMTKPGAAEDPAYVANVSTPLHICHICNSVQYNAKDLRKHQNKHLRCQFCKTRFRSLETKKQHISKSCPIKNAMNYLPDVVLERVEDNKKARKKYPDAFREFPVFNNNNNNNKSGKENVVMKPEIETFGSENANKPQVSTAPAIDVIEIHSDEEDSTPPSRGNNSESSNSAGGSVPQNNTNDNPRPQSSPSIPPIVPPIPENVVYNTVSIVRPDVRIRNNYLLDNMDPKISDTKLLKHLLVNYKHIQLTAEQSNQTEPPSNDSIVINGDDSAELKDLKKQLYAYKIPVSIKLGSFNVSYNSTVQEQRSRKLHLWRNLAPVDVQVNNVNVPKSVSETVVRESEKQGSDVNNTKTTTAVLPATVTYNSASSSFLPNLSSSTANTRTLVPPTSSCIAQITNNPSLKTLSTPKSSLPATITSGTFNAINASTALYQPAPTVNIPVTFSLVKTTTAQPQSSTNTNSTNLLLGNSYVVPTSVQPQLSLNSASTNTLLLGNSYVLPTSVQTQLSLNNPSNNVLLGNSSIVPTSVSHSSLNNTSNSLLLSNSCVVPTSVQPRSTLASAANNVLLGNNYVVPTSHISLNVPNNRLIGNNYVIPTSVQPHSNMSSTSNTVLLGKSSVIPISIQSNVSLNNTPNKTLPSNSCMVPTSAQPRINNVRLGNSSAVSTSGPPRASNNASSSTVVGSDRLDSNSIITPTSDAMINDLVDRKLSRSNPTLQSAVPVAQSNVDLMLNNNSVLPNTSAAYQHSLSSSAISGASTSSINNVLPGTSSAPQSSSSSTITVGTIRVKNVWELT